jgi:hypothetical protein
MQPDVLPSVSYQSMRHWQRWGLKPLGQCSLIQNGWQSNCEEWLRLLASRRSGARIVWYGQHEVNLGEAVTRHHFSHTDGGQTGIAHRLKPRNEIEFVLYFVYSRFLADIFSNRWLSG